jgi:NTE family protein
VLGLVAALAGCSSLPPAPVEPVTPPVIDTSSVPVTPAWRTPRVGLALGGGAARGFAHVGVIQVLDRTASGRTW